MAQSKDIHTYPREFSLLLAAMERTTSPLSLTYRSPNEAKHQRFRYYGFCRAHNYTYNALRHDLLMAMKLKAAHEVDSLKREIAAVARQRDILNSYELVFIPLSTLCWRPRSTRYSELRDALNAMGAPQLTILEQLEILETATPVGGNTPAQEAAAFSNILNEVDALSAPMRTKSYEDCLRDGEIQQDTFKFLLPSQGFAALEAEIRKYCIEPQLTLMLAALAAAKAQLDSPAPSAHNPPESTANALDEFLPITKES